MHGRSRDYDPLSGRKEFGYGAAPEARRQDRRVPHVGPIPVADLPSGGYGGAPGGGEGDWVRFHNLKPRRRSERRAVLDKESLEKARLAQRVGGYAKYEDPGNVAGSAAGASSAGYMPESERFITDVAGEAKLEREEAAARKAAAILRRREESRQREELRWKRMDEAKKEEEDRVHRMREDGGKAAKNVGSMPYDFVTLQYRSGDEGDKLKYQDQRVMYRAAMRAQHLQAVSSGQRYDVLTGQAKSLPPLPNAPKPPPAVGAAGGGGGR